MKSKKFTDPFGKITHIQRKQTKELLDQVFGDFAIKFGLNFFQADIVEKLLLYKKENKIYLQCFLTAKERIAKPEEIVRQLMLLYLHKKLSYPWSQMEIEVPIKMGVTYASKKADIVVYQDDDRISPRIIVELKKPTRRDGLEQLHSYMNATGVYFGAWINGKESVSQLRTEPNIFEEINRLPAIHETIDDIKEPLQRKQLEPIKNLKETIQYLEDEVLASAGVNTFDEMFKLIFAKLYDEFEHRKDSDYMDFRTTTGSLIEQAKRIKDLFSKAREEWPDIFDEHDEIKLPPAALVSVVSAMQKYKFFDGDLDVLDAAFEYLVNPEQKGGKGQYFTPRHVVDMMVKMLNPKARENMIDPACGPCGFPIHTFNWVKNHELKDQPKDRKKDYAQRRLFAIDFDIRLVKVAKALMLIAGDGRTNVFHANSLDSRDWAGKPIGPVVKEKIFDVLMTNPPFAGEIKQAEVLAKYALAYKGDSTKNKRASQVSRELLFIERSLWFLKPSGRMAIVLPQGILNNTNAEYVREWIMDKARILAVVGLGQNTFKPFTGTKTSVLLLQKHKENKEFPEDYPIFMATSQKSGKDNSGEYIYKEIDGKRVLDHDLDDIAEAFIEFAKEQKFDFWG